MSSPARRLSAPLLAAALLAATPLPAQEPPTFGERVEVRVVEVDVVVTDREGQRVRGIGRDEFTLLVDGRETGIDYFTEVVGGTVEQLAAEEADAPAVTAVGAPRPTSYLVFVDDYFTYGSRDRNILLERIGEQLDRMGPADRVAVVAFDGRRLDLLVPWTGSRREITAALAEATDRPTFGHLIQARIRHQDVQGANAAAAEATRRQALGQDTSTAAPQDLQAWNPALCSAIRDLERDVDRVAFGAAAALRSLPTPPGRKVALMLSGGWPLSARQYFLADQPLDANVCRERRGLLDPVHETANLLGYTLYMVDVPSATAPSPVSAEARTAGGPPAPWRTSEVRGSLHELADRTGGRAFIGGPREEALARVVEDTRSYYSLGFTPEWEANDEEHEIAVRVDRPGVEVRHREGFEDLSADTRVAHLTETALLVDGVEGAARMDVSVDRIGGRRGKMRVPVELKVPLDPLTFVERQGGWAADLELRVAVVDEDGNRNQISAEPVAFGGPQPPPPGAHAVYATEIELRRRPHDLVLTLYQPLTGALLAAELTVDPG